MKNIYILFLFCILRVQAYPVQHPHILVSDKDKSVILKKTQSEEWAGEIFDNIKNKLSEYVERHKSNPDWILSRYIMNRIPGKRYTHFVSDAEGTHIIESKGDAPIPTIRIPSHKRMPVTPEGMPYVAPKIEDIIPNDTSLYMSLKNPSTDSFEKVDPQNYIAGINGMINELAYEASVVYWLIGSEDYAKFAADILDQWVNAAVYQYPIDGSGRAGYLNIQTLGDESSKSLILAYDFLYPYLKKKGYSLKNYDAVFERIAKTLCFRGYATNNWFAAESSTLVSAALSLSDKSKRDYYLDYFLKCDTVCNGYGQISLLTASKTWFTPDGHWKEPGGYHNYPVSKLMESAMMLENNGYNIFSEYPVLLQAAYVMLKYSFPDMTVSAFGDTGRPQQSVDCLEIGIKMAEKYSLPILGNLVDAAERIRCSVGYDRSKSGITGMLCFLPQHPITLLPSETLWNRSEKLDFASCYIQRNGMDLKTGLMYVLQGASYNHNHSNGMSMELYGAGTVMGLDSGNGPTYEHPLHVDYYTQWGAHNTVVAGGSSYSLKPFKGSGGKKEIGAVKLSSMEPETGQKALSENISYTYAKYFEGFTKTNQERLMAIFRIDDSNGFYVDMYRSDNKFCNDYLYHNIGDKVELYNFGGTLIRTNSVKSYPIVGNDYPGMRYLSDVKETKCDIDGVHAVFSAEDLPKGKGYMNMWMPSTPDFKYYTSYGLEAKTACMPYRSKKVPLVSIHIDKPTGDTPFIVVYEPSLTSTGGIVESVERIYGASTGTYAAFRVCDKKGGKHIFVNSEHSDFKLNNDLKFMGDFGVFSQTDKKRTMYLGNGTFIEDNDIIIECNDGLNGDAFVEFSEDSFVVRSNVSISVTIKNKVLCSKYFMNKKQIYGKGTDIVILKKK